MELTADCWLGICPNVEAVPSWKCPFVEMLVAREL